MVTQRHWRCHHDHWKHTISYWRFTVA